MVFTYMALPRIPWYIALAQNTIVAPENHVQKTYHANVCKCLDIYHVQSPCCFKTCAMLSTCEYHVDAREHVSHSVHWYSIYYSTIVLFNVYKEIRNMAVQNFALIVFNRNMFVFSCDPFVNAESCCSWRQFTVQLFRHNSLSICYSAGSVPPYLLVTAKWKMFWLGLGGKELDKCLLLCYCHIHQLIYCNTNKKYFKKQFKTTLIPFQSNRQLFWPFLTYEGRSHWVIESKVSGSFCVLQHEGQIISRGKNTKGGGETRQSSLGSFTCLSRLGIDVIFCDIFTPTGGYSRLCEVL